MLMKTVTAMTVTAVCLGMAMNAEARKKPLDGPEVFEKMCVKCHYISGVPGFDTAESGKKDLRQALSDPALIEDRVTNGFKKGANEMPAFKYKSKFMKQEFPVLLEWLTSQK